MTFGGRNPYQPPGAPHGNPYQPPPAPSGNPFVTPPGTPPQDPYVLQPGPYGPVPQHTSVWRRLRDDEWPTLGEVLRGGRQRVHGCVWALLLMPCLWGMTVPLLVCYPLARSARSRARRLFPARGHRRVGDPEVARVQKARAWTAAVTSFLILIAYGKPEDMAQAQQQYWMRLVITPWLLLLSAPVVVTVLLCWAPSDVRGVMRRRLRAAGRSVLWYFGAFGLVPVLALAGGLTTAGLTEGASVGASQVFLAPLLFFGAFVPMLWALLFVVFASGPAVRSAFNTAEVHAALPALLTCVLVWEFAVIGLVAGGPPPGPPAMQLCTLLGGPASVTAVGWWEIHRLRTRYGVVLRR